MRLAMNVVTLIRAMAKDNALWGVARIRGEFLKLGFRVSKRTIQKYMKRVRPSGSRGQSWRTFIGNHSGGIWACDFLQLYDVLFRPIFAFFFMVHGTREVVHFNVTRCPTDACAAQRLREATPHSDRPKYLIRDNDDKFGKRFAPVAEGTKIEVVKILLRSPNLEPHLRTLSWFGARGVPLPRGHPHRATAASRSEGVRRDLLQSRSAPSRFVATDTCRRIAVGPKLGGKVVQIPILGGLHHDYQWVA